MFMLPSPHASAGESAAAEHHCLVQEPMWDSWKDLLRRNPSQRFTEDLLKAGLRQVLLALDFLHRECKLVHTDIKSDNILQHIGDKRILEAFTNAELAAPSARKVVNGHTIYRSGSSSSHNLSATWSLAISDRRCGGMRNAKTMHSLRFTGRLRRCWRLSGATQ